MNVDETIKVMAMLSAYYGQPKGDSQQMAKAWHMILRDYDFKDAERAVIEFARNDTRDYNVFPTIGKFVQAVEQMRKLPYRIIGKARKGIKYSELDAIEKNAISEKAYNRALEMPEEKLLNNVNVIVNYINQDKKLITESEVTK